MSEEPRKIKAGDTVLHKPSGETWTIACVDESGRSVVKSVDAGSPGLFAQAHDCELIQSCTSEESLRALRVSGERHLWEEYDAIGYLARKGLLAIGDADTVRDERAFLKRQIAELKRRLELHETALAALPENPLALVNFDCPECGCMLKLTPIKFPAECYAARCMNPGCSHSGYLYPSEIKLRKSDRVEVEAAEVPGQERK